MKTPTDPQFFKILRRHGINDPSENLIREVRSFFFKIAQTNSYFKNFDSKEKKREYARKVKQLQKNINNNFGNVTSITVATKKGSTIFHKGDPGFVTFNSLFLEYTKQLPDMSLDGKLKEQLEYLQSAQFRFPFIVFEYADRDQYFVTIIKASIELGKYLYNNCGIRKKAGLRRLIMDLTAQQLPELEVTEENEKKTFRIHFNPHL